MNPQDDPTSIGAILLRMGAITSDVLAEAIEEQANLSIEHLLGKLLIANGTCTLEQIEIAVAAQRDMRCGDKAKEAVAIASIATVRKRMVRSEERKRVISSGERVARKVGSGTEFSAVAMKMSLMGGGSDGKGSNSEE